MIQNLARWFANPYPLRSLVIRGIRKLQLGRYDHRLTLGAVERPHYGYCVYNASLLASRLGYKRISVLEFGVAGGRGLLNLEYHAAEVEKLLPIEIEVYGFDTGEGLPRPIDYRDLPYHWKAGFFRMDVPKLKARLKKAKLVLGNVENTVASFFSSHQPAPIGAIMLDLDFYSSTVAALNIFSGEEKYFLPRIYCYLDDVIGSEAELYNDYTGVRLAIQEFNAANHAKKFGIPYHLLSSRVVESWYHQIQIYHNFGHSRYNDFVSTENQHIPLVR